MSAAIDNAERGRLNRRRGAEAERMVVNYLRANGYPDARRYLAGDGRQPGDIDGWHPLICCEVKDVAKSAWPSWCRQAVAEAREGMVPVVVRRTRGVPDVGAWECRTTELFLRADTRVDIDAIYEVDHWPWFGLRFGDFVRLVREVEG